MPNRVDEVRNTMNNTVQTWHAFTMEAEKGDWTDADVTADHDVIVYFARK